MSCEANPLGPVLAACVGTALAFRAALREGSLPKVSRISLFNLCAGPAADQGPRLPEAVDLGAILLVGCGAVGSAIASLLPMVRARCAVSAVDGDVVEISNLNRSPMFLLCDVGKPKAAVLGRAPHSARCVRRGIAELVRSGGCGRQRASPPTRHHRAGSQRAKTSDGRSSTTCHRCRSTGRRAATGMRTWVGTFRS